MNRKAVKRVLNAKFHVLYVLQDENFLRSIFNFLNKSEILLIALLYQNIYYLEMMGGRPLPAGELGRELQAVAEQVVEVLHHTNIITNNNIHDPNYHLHPVVHEIPLSPVT